MDDIVNILKNLRMVVQKEENYWKITLEERSNDSTNGEDDPVCAEPDFVVKEKPQMLEDPLFMDQYDILLTMLDDPVLMGVYPNYMSCLEVKQHDDEGRLITDSDGNPIYLTDGYRVGFTLNEHVFAIGTLLRMTKDVRLYNHLRKIALYMLNRADQNEFLEWPYRRPGYENTVYYGQSGTITDDLVFGVLTYLADIVNQNEPDSILAQRLASASYDHLKKWVVNSDKQSLPIHLRAVQDLTHTYMQLYRGVGYLDEMLPNETVGGEDISVIKQRLKEDMDGHFVKDEDCYVWDHRIIIPEFNHSPLGPQSTGYASITVMAVVDQFLNNYETLDKEKLQRWVNTAEYLISDVAFAGDVAGNNEESWRRYTIGSWPVFGLFSDQIDSINNIKHEAHTDVVNLLAHVLSAKVFRAYYA